MRISSKNSAITILGAPPVATHGWGRYTRDLISALVARGAEITLITDYDAPADPGLPLADYHRLLPSVIHPARFNTARLLRVAPHIRQLTAAAAQVYIFAEPHTLAASLVQGPLTISAHGTYISRSLRRRGSGRVVSWLYRRVYQHSRIVCVSHYTERTVNAVLPNVATSVILNGVDVARYRQSVALPAKAAPTVLAVGQVKARKGYHVLVAAMMALRAYMPEVQAVFIGDLSDAAYVGALRAQITAAGMNRSIKLLGRVDDETLIGWYQSADVFALPALNVDGKFEGFGLAYLEAGAAGLPAIGTLECGAEDAILDGQTGLLVPQSDVTALTTALRQLLSDPQQRAQMAAAAKSYAESQTWDSIAERWLAL